MWAWLNEKNMGVCLKSYFLMTLPQFGPQVKSTEVNTAESLIPLYGNDFANFASWVALLIN